MLMGQRWRVESLDDREVVLKRRGSTPARISFSEILSAERRPTPWGLRLHLRTSGEPLYVSCSGRRRFEIEGQLRSCGVRIVDEYGAMITPTLADFEEELAREPERLRQSSDNA